MFYGRGKTKALLRYNKIYLSFLFYSEKLFDLVLFSETFGTVAPFN
jgi:hypothetical protein